MQKKNGNHAFHNAQLPHRTYIEIKNYLVVSLYFIPCMA